MDVIFGPNHYVPVLKVKRGEKAALLALAAPLCSRITPLLEIVERKVDKAPNVEKHLDTTFKDLAGSAKLFSRCFLDARELAADGPAAAAQVFQRAVAAGIVFTPVTGLSRAADVAAAMTHRQHGLMLRLTRDEFESGGLTVAIGRFLTTHGLSPEQVDLFVDLGAVDQMVVAGIMALTDAFLADIPDHPRWRTLTVSACAFPMSMGGVERHSQSHVERGEWIAWRDGLHARRNSLPRLPTFSDCGIQYPKGVEDFDPRTMQVSAAIRYARPDEWLLIKGESTRQTPPSDQFPVLATRLVYGHLRDYFLGPTHCRGCELMKNAADGAPKLGSPEMWRKFGTIHHMTMVMDGLAALPWI
ncbi:MAG: beta family protein [Gammaproteobacteria bacterium]|nr:beta family protein [Gammaproteobacteria bacterium]